MNEPQRYKKFIIAWVFFLTRKHWTEDRFSKAHEAIKEAMHDDELEAARGIWKEENK